MNIPRIPFEVRFWMKVRFTPTCWEWKSNFNGTGYGRIKVGRKNIAAHRWAYEFCRGPIAEGMTLDHLCRNRKCINPEHLEEVSLKENILRGTAPSAQYARSINCKWGHPLEQGKRQRFCRTCARKSGLAFYCRNRERINSERKA